MLNSLILSNQQICNRIRSNQLHRTYPIFIYLSPWHQNTTLHTPHLFYCIIFPRENSKNQKIHSQHSVFLVCICPDPIKPCHTSPIPDCALHLPVSRGGKPTAVGQQLRKVANKALMRISSSYFILFFIATFAFPWEKWIFGLCQVAIFWHGA